MDHPSPVHPGHLLARRLNNFQQLSPDECEQLVQLANAPAQLTPARRDLIREGTTIKALNLIVDGWVARYKTLPDGRRQIVAFLVPGDLCDLNSQVMGRMDHALGALTPVQHVSVSFEAAARVQADNPVLRDALWWQLLVNFAIQREWTLNNGQRSALERIGHLFCELQYRLASVGLADGATFDFPLTQTDLGEATGITSVHVNRTLQEMRASGLIKLRSRQLEIMDLDRLRETVQFDAGYLHQRGPAAPDDNTRRASR